LRSGIAVRAGANRDSLIPMSVPDRERRYNAALTVQTPPHAFRIPNPD